MAKANVTINSISRDVVSLKDGYDETIIDFEADIEIDAYKLIARKDGYEEEFEKMETLWPQQNLIPDESLIPIDFLHPANIPILIDVDADQLTEGDGSYEIELLARGSSSRGEW